MQLKIAAIQTMKLSKWGLIENHKLLGRTNEPPNKIAAAEDLVNHENSSVH
jgi:hypothetical protein